MELTTLDQFSLQQITAAFNESFTGYFVPLQLSVEQMHQKLVTENICLDVSVAAVEEGRLCGFVLNALDKADGALRAYNGGTGVVPAARGQYLTVKMLQWIIPALVAKGAATYHLEVFDKNIAAIKSYMRCNFKIERLLFGYKGKPVEQVPPPKNGSLEWIPVDRFQTFKKMPCWSFTWQFSDAAVSRTPGLQLLVNTGQDTIISYLVYNPVSKRIIQIGAEPCNLQTSLPAMLASIKELTTDDITLINVDEKAGQVHDVLKMSGLQHFISLYEMHLPLC